MDPSWTPTTERNCFARVTDAFASGKAHIATPPHQAGQGKLLIEVDPDYAATNLTNLVTADPVGR